MCGEWWIGVDGMGAKDTFSVARVVVMVVVSVGELGPIALLDGGKKTQMLVAACDAIDTRCVVCRCVPRLTVPSVLALHA